MTLNLMRRLLSISSCLMLIVASFMAYFTHEHNLATAHSQSHIVHSHFKLHLRLPYMGGRATGMDETDPPAKYLDAFWLQSSAPRVIPVSIPEILTPIAPSSMHSEKLEPLELPAWRGPPFQDHCLLRSPPSNSRA